MDFSRDSRIRVKVWCRPVAEIEGTHRIRHIRNNRLLVHIEIEASKKPLL